MPGPVPPVDFQDLGHHRCRGSGWISAARHDAVGMVIAWDPSTSNLTSLDRIATQLGIPFVTATSAQEAVELADILITATPSQQAPVMKHWVRPGTHINAMGADTIGNQALAPGLVALASIYVDVLEQAINIGECQHAIRQGLIGREKLTQTLGGFASGRLQERRSNDKIMLFDGTDIAPQDFAATSATVSRARELGLGMSVAL